MANQPPFKAFTIKANGRVDRIITEITVLPAFDPKAPPDPVPVGVKTQALWDTGASTSVLSGDLVKSLGLQASGATKVNHAGGASTSPTYVVNFQLPHAVGVAGIIASEFQAAPNSFGAIVGMDVICHGDFAITNVSGQTWISFRSPSCATVDYVVEWNRMMFAGTPRNAPYPCGAGKKFKFCHGAA